MYKREGGGGAWWKCESELTCLLHSQYTLPCSPLSRNWNSSNSFKFTPIIFLVLAVSPSAAILTLYTCFGARALELNSKPQLKRICARIEAAGTEWPVMVLLNLSEMASKALGQLSSCSEEAVIHVVHGTDARFYHYLCDGQDDRVGESQRTRYHCRYIR